MAYVNMTDIEYKSLHEKFMQNHNGTTAMDTFAIILPNFFSTCIAKQTILYLGVKNNFYKFVLEYFLLIIPVILFTTVLAEYRFTWLFLSVIIFIVLHYNQFSFQTFWNAKIDRRRKWQCISSIRSLVLLVTCFSILAVDFNIFPRYLAKTEKFGYSFMDAGVGLFIFCNGLIPSKVSRHSLYKTLELNFKQCAILLLLGIGRVIVTKEVNYQQHTSEYGLHWNFFISLAVAKFISIIIMCIFKESNSLIFGLIILGSYEIMLFKGLSSWVFSDIPRNNFVTANREGLTSCIGFVALFLISSYIGQIVRETYKDKKERDVIFSLSSITIISWLTVYLSAYLGVSRCLANMGYCSFIIAVGTTHLMLFYLYEINEITILNKEQKIKSRNNILSNYTMPTIYSAINDNGLLFFLTSNLLTGLINLCFRTLFIDSINSLFILMGYMITIVGVIIYFQKKKIYFH